MPLAHVLEQANIVMIFLLVVVAVAVRFGRGPAILAAFVSVAAFDFFFVSPRFSFAVADVQYLVTFSVMLVVALVIGQMTAGLTYQARVAQRREDRMRALYDMSRLSVRRADDRTSRGHQRTFSVRRVWCKVGAAGGRR